MTNLKKYLPHVYATIAFLIISLCYFYPVIPSVFSKDAGKKIYQSDIVQYVGMAKEQNDFRTQTQTEPYWTNSAFGGMPTYQLGAKYPNDYIGKIDDMLRFLPRPADYLFLYFIAFYTLLLVLKAKPLEAFFGALAFGFSTYLIIILGVGHNAKAHAIAYMPLVVAGVLLVFRKKYIIGGLLTMFATALEINANHFQMTYYLLFLLLIIGIYYTIYYIKNNQIKELSKIILTLGVALIFAIGSNATSLLATSEYAKFSTRNKSELTYLPNGKKKQDKTTLDRSYITEYSYGIGESFNLLVPKLLGGGNSEVLGTNSSVYEFMESMGASPEEAQTYAANYGKTYWGDQPIVAAPAYIGAVVFFLAVLALYHDKRKLKYVFLAGALFSLVLSWGKNLDFVTNFFIDFIPMYDKFRAVSSIQVILELCMPAIAIMGLHSFLYFDENKRLKNLKYASITVGALLLCLFISSFFLDFAGPIDKQLRAVFSQGPDKSFATDFLSALKEDRKSLFKADVLRSSFFIILVAIALYLYCKQKLAQTTTIIIVGLVMVFDLFFIDKNYVGKKDFVSAHEVDVPFEPTTADMQILQDKTNYRVLEVDGNLSSARASYFHKSIGGYSAVKPQKMQELFDYQIAKNNRNTLNMLNVKYILQTDEKGEPYAVANPQANGNAWFVKELKQVNSADAEMKALDKLNTKNEAVISNSNSVIYNSNFDTKPAATIIQTNFVVDSLAKIRVSIYEPNKIKYLSNNTNKGFAVFSEMYYKNGWNATIDGKKAPIFKVNYTLRGLQIPAGKHTIEFKFEPQVVKTGSTIMMISFLLMSLLLIGGIYFERKQKTI